jgi:4-aminobutyrate aminotransferase-like enzyme
MTASQPVLDLLREYESRNVTFISEDGSWPIVWDRARGNYVRDVEGRRYLDLTAAFGVAAAGHANARVVEAGQRQMRKLLHAMGDVHPHPLKAQLARELSRITFERWAQPSLHPSPIGGERVPERAGEGVRAKTIFCNSGFEAVEAGLKTALLATGKPGVIAFQGGYHGLGYGALNTTHREHFRKPFLAQLGEFGHFLPFPTKTDEVVTLELAIHRTIRQHRIGAVLVEPVQARGGINVPPPQFLPMLRRVSKKSRVLLVLDEIYTGFGRTGRWFACEHWAVIPDIICLGKALTGGFPLSACVGRAELMDRAWPVSRGEAIHTSTFLGHPVGCAMALAQIQEIDERRLVERAAQLGNHLLAQLRELRAPAHLRLTARGLGLLAGLEIRTARGAPASRQTLELMERMLQQRFIVLPEGEKGNVLALTPPLMTTKRLLNRALEILQQQLLELS